MPGRSTPPAGASGVPRLRPGARAGIWALVLIPCSGAAWGAGLLDFFFAEPGEVGRLLLQHIWLVLAASGTAIPLGVGLGVGISRPRLRLLAPPVLLGAGLGQTIPALALLALIFAVVGQIGFLPAWLALSLATLLPVVRNTYLGLTATSPALLDAGRGMGMNPVQVLWRLELPNALPVILAGIRTAVVINVSSAALAFLIGGGGLGDLIFTGIDTRRADILFAGALPTTLLALGADWILGRIERRVIPPGIGAIS